MPILSDPFKYRLKAAALVKFGATWKRSFAATCAGAGITESQFNRDISLRLSEAGEVPFKRLRIYARVLGVTVDELNADYTALLLKTNPCTP